MSAGKSICKMKAFSHIIWKNKDSLITGFMESIKTYVNQEQILIEKGTHCPNQNCLILLKAKPARIIFVKILLSPWDLFFPPCLHLLASLLHFFSLLHSFLQTFFANSTQYQQRIPETWTVKSYTLPCAKLCDPSSGWLFGWFSLLGSRQDDHNGAESVWCFGCYKSYKTNAEINPA